MLKLPVKKPGLSVAYEILPWLWQQDLNGVLPLLRRDDPHLLEELRHQLLTPFIYQQVLCHGRQKSLPPPVLRGLAHDYALALKAAAGQEQEARRVIRALDQAGVAVILLKGADLRLRVYGDPAVRPMADLDLLIDPAQLQQGLAALARLGYSPASSHRDPKPGFREQFGHEITLEPPPGGRLLVDLHWEIRAVACYYRLPFEFLQSQSIFWHYGDLPVKVLSPEHALIHLSLHTFGDSLGAFPEALPLLDLALVLTRLSLDWSRFLGESARCGCRLPICCMLQEMSHLVPQAIPVGVLTQLQQYRPPLAEKLVIRLVRSLRFLAGKFPRLEEQRHFWEWATFYLAGGRGKANL